MVYTLKTSNIGTQSANIAVLPTTAYVSKDGLSITATNFTLAVTPSANSTSGGKLQIPGSVRIRGLSTSITASSDKYPWWKLKSSSTINRCTTIVQTKDSLYCKIQ